MNEVSTESPIEAEMTYTWAIYRFIKGLGILCRVLWDFL
ncbi:MAG: hypothetical protein ACI9O0_000255 [Paracoccaceae bacterium]|jgi:hypothetical protein